VKDKISGIYRIVCTKNGRYYYGSSKNIRRRWNEHKNLLRKNAHWNPVMQRSWNKHGIDSFRIELIEKISKDSLFEVEQIYLTEHVGKSNCMNVQEKPTGGGHFLADWWKSDKAILARQQQSCLWKERAKDPEYRKELQRRGKVGARKAALARQKTYMGFVSPKGIIFSPVINLNAFCREHGLDNRLLNGVDKGKRNHHKGWTKYNE